MFRSEDGGVTWAASRTGLFATNVYSLAVDPFTPGMMYLGTTSLGAYRSLDGGQTWSPMEVSGGYVTAFSTDPSTPGTVYAATYANGVSKTTDSGVTWANIGLRNSSRYSVAVAPADPLSIYTGGVFNLRKTEDGGQTWFSSYSFVDALWAALAVDPTDANVAYAGSLGYAPPIRTVDGGRNWRVVTNGFPYTTVSSLAIDPSATGTIYLGCVFGLWKSTDNAGHWGRIGAGIAGVNSVVVNPADPSIVYAGTQRGIFVSSDAGASWAPMNDGLTDLNVWALAIDPAGSTLYAGTTGGGAFVFDLP